MTVFTLIILLILLVISYFIAKSKMSLQKKLIIIIGTIVLILGSISYIFVTGFDRGMRVERVEATIDYKSNDSIAILDLTKKLYQWNETESKVSDFDALLKNKNDSVYSEIDQSAHQKRLEELRKINLFTEDFINNYDKIAMKIERNEIRSISL